MTDTAQTLRDLMALVLTDGTPVGNQPLLAKLRRHVPEAWQRQAIEGLGEVFSKNAKHRRL